MCLLRAFYLELRDRLRIDGAFRFKRFNVKMLMVHLICTVTAYNKHLNAPLTVDGLFAGSLFLERPHHKLWALAVTEGDGVELCVPSFAEYAMVVLHQGAQQKNLSLSKIWMAMLKGLGSKEEQKAAVGLYVETQKRLKRLEDDIKQKNRSRNMPFTACCVSHLQSSASL